MEIYVHNKRHAIYRWIYPPVNRIFHRQIWVADGRIGSLFHVSANIYQQKFPSITFSNDFCRWRVHQNSQSPAIVGQLKMPTDGLSATVRPRQLTEDGNRPFVEFADGLIRWQMARTGSQPESVLAVCRRTVRRHSVNFIYLYIFLNSVIL